LSDREGECKTHSFLASLPLFTLTLRKNRLLSIDYDQLTVEKPKQAQNLKIMTKQMFSK
jgi:hypothetical protein